ncbi:MAG TPA: glutaminyl-peptide cyclotransferase [Candidatus Kapabacteria bacterium]|jgi:glutamine cyclotransferase|nr:glutaminyl-peptide cyclotransferase [Candidatus Kapabacteria bacterium]HOV91602.1 glutaminyl-peptide cyclotransferase [Candidatus Kapabacteria bacterium]
MKLIYYSILAVSIICIYSCNSNSKKIEQTNNSQHIATSQNPSSETTTSNISKKVEFEIIKKYPHNKDAYTQGLIFYGGYLYESTGLYGHSSLRKVNIKDGKVLKQINLLPLYFGEGITLLADKIYQLTWENHKGFIYNLDFEKLGEFSYPGEGWGITNDGKSLIISDGSNYLSFYDPSSMNIIKTISVEDNNTPIFNLNELEWVDGLIYANVYMQDEIIAINPDNGKVVYSFDVSELRSALDDQTNAEVSNGIAYNPSTKSFFLTGKYWPNLFEVKIKK